MSDVSIEYGRALFELSEEEHTEGEMLEELRFLNELFQENKDFIQILASSNIPLNERLNVITQAFDNRLSEYVCSFLKLITERGYALHIPQCIKTFEKMYYEKYKITIAYVQSAVVLSEKQRTALTQKLQTYCGKTVQLRCSVVPELIGGICVTIDGKRLEGTIRHRIDTIRSNLQKTTL